MTDPRDIRPVLLRGGRVIDPSQQVDRTSSVLLTGGMITEIGDRLKIGRAHV